MSSAVLTAHGVSKAFGGVKACIDVDLELHSGQVTALIGPNGAGKTSLFNCLSGHSVPDSGRVELHGDDITGHKAHEFAEHGLSRTFQNLETFASLTVHESVQIGAHLTGSAGLWSSIFRTGKHRRDEQEIDEQSRVALERVGISHLADRLAASVDPGSLRLAEIARAIVRHPDVLFLDEPVAGLSAVESAEVAAVITTLGQEGTAVMISEHDLPTVMAVAQHVYVLNNGQVISAGTPDDVRADPVVIAAYLGDEWDPRSEESA